MDLAFVDVALGINAVLPLVQARDLEGSRPVRASAPTVWQEVVMTFTGHFFHRRNPDPGTGHGLQDAAHRVTPHHPAADRARREIDVNTRGAVRVGLDLEEASAADLAAVEAIPSVPIPRTLAGVAARRRSDLDWPEALARQQPAEAALFTAAEGDPLETVDTTEPDQRP
ncbi:MAG: hypothetical protein J4F98_14030, partial [Acidobacteria bacterium]|nr:hypothetical protein [Acidobacteriota bacterium]